MFGVTKITIPGILDAEAQLAIGFRNSHDKSMAVRIAVGASVMVCDNMLITGDINIRRLSQGPSAPVHQGGSVNGQPRLL
jgi:hypothetical protein